jgi:exosortase
VDFAVASAIDWRSYDTPRSRQLLSRYGPIIIGLAALTLPTMASLAKWSWPTDEGAQGPIVIATGAWMIWRERTAFGKPDGLAPVAALLFVPMLIAYAIGRITSIMIVETAALFAIYGLTAVMLFGARWITKLWFPLIYFLFALPLPPNFVTGATQPLKFLISQYAVDLLAHFGYAVGRSGIVIQVDQYQLLVATACTGVNSMIGITAISIMYIYLKHGQNWRLTVPLLLLVVPIGMLLNFLRVVLLILKTHYLGDAVAQGITHELDGFIMFALAMGMLFLLEGPIERLVRLVERPSAEIRNEPVASNG